MVEDLETTTGFEVAAVEVEAVGLASSEVTLASLFFTITGGAGRLPLLLSLSFGLMLGSVAWWYFSSM